MCLCGHQNTYDSSVYSVEEPTVPSILEEAMQVTRESREKEYAHPLINFARMSWAWTGRLRKKLKEDEWVTPEDVAWMMIESKDARASKTYKRDNVVDAAGYADCMGRMDEYMKELGYNGIQDFENMTLSQFCKFLGRLENP